MKTNLQEMRKRAGFKSAREFAEHIGMSVRTYTNYEQGITALTLEKAWEFADILECSLDELAGRDFKKPTYKSPLQERLNGYYESMNEKGQSLLVESAKHMSSSTELRIEKERQYPYNQAAMGA